MRRVGDGGRQGEGGTLFLPRVADWDALRAAREFSVAPKPTEQRKTIPTLPGAPCAHLQRAPQGHFRRNPPPGGVWYY